MNKANSFPGDYFYVWEYWHTAYVLIKQMNAYIMHL